MASTTAHKIADLEGEALIVPEPKSRPHSHDLTIKLSTSRTAPSVRRRRQPLQEVVERRRWSVQG
ncbi:hypothetical protein QA640_17405 [Bradyrhizobium sp. CB82]|uniref:hypothetical protein n=1 Tax=Bradyrhizobium sp. CB82 TaxID=3039159 RepID=UPI0024B27830|nr:hypothetical protein [Bradyrhizobium sp. CB82]WFU44061.1 hypothetical protein QA640_17405 [Bradyrhizobium sp. CB82]